MKRAEAIEWLEVMKEDAIFEQYDALKMAIEALQTAEINCVHCPRYYETEDDTGVHSHCGSHGRLIDADALKSYLLSLPNPKQDSFTTWATLVSIRMDELAQIIDNAPTIQANRPQGEWICKGDYAICSKCGGSSGTQFDGVERIPRITTYCPHCGVRMKVGEK